MAVSLTPSLSQGEMGTKARAARDFHGKAVRGAKNPKRSDFPYVHYAALPLLGRSPQPPLRDNRARLRIRCSRNRSRPNPSSRYDNA
jgi:hypothetical protein